MDETTQSTASNAAATKKRRSSILKSQRTVRTPFSDLEFNVATPPDTTKSRRVSFSRRTGVAEFATNEATTTWKTFYEEHNKSLESSGNDSGANSSKQLSCIGKRLFDQQFEEVEADFIGSLNPGFNYNSSITNVNFGQVSIHESTADFKLSNSQRQLSLLTETQSKVFGDELTMHQMGENSQPIDFDFSAIKQIEGKDDLDEIKKDLQNNQNIICHGAFDRQNISEYIEVDLNSTHVTIKSDVSDMSITDTIHSPKVQEVSKSVSIEKVPCKDWVADKENIVINPYVTPKESTNFAISEEPDKVLVFDGKRLTLQADTVPEPVIKCPAPQNVQPLRKTIVLNVHDDLPNFINDPHSSALGYLSVADLKYNTEFDSDMSTTKSLSKSDQSQSQKTVVFGDFADISITQAVPTNIVQEKRRTITQAVPTNIIESNNITRYENETGNVNITQEVPTKVTPQENIQTITQTVSTNIIEKTEKTRTILYDSETGNLTVTEIVPQEKIKTFVYDDEEANKCMTQSFLPNIKTENIQKRRTVVIEDDSGNLSITQAIPIKIIDKNSPENNRTLGYEDKAGKVSVTQSTSSSISESDAKIQMRRTVIFDSETGNISITQVVPGNIVLPKNNSESNNISVTQSLTTNMDRRCTIIFDSDDADISMTQAVPVSTMLSDINTNDKIKKRTTILFDNENADMSVTQAIDRDILPAFQINAKPTEKRQTIFDDADISITQVIDRSILPALKIENVEPIEKRQTVFDVADISLTQVVDHNILPGLNIENAEPTEKGQSVFDDANISITRAVDCDKLPALNIKRAKPVLKKQKRFDDADISITQVFDSEILPACHFENAEPTEKGQTVFDDANISITRAVDCDKLPALNIKRAKPVLKRQKRFDDADISITQVFDSEILPACHFENAEPTEKRQTVFDEADISLTQVVDHNILPALNIANAEPTEKGQTVFDDANISITRAVDCDKLPALNIKRAKPVLKRQKRFDDADISITQVFDSEILPACHFENAEPTEKRQTVFDEADISLTQVVDHNILPALNIANAEPTEKGQTVFDDANISITRAVDCDKLPALNIKRAKPVLKRQKRFDDADISITQVFDSEILPACHFENAEPTEKGQTVFDDANISITRAVDCDKLPALNIKRAKPVLKRQKRFDDADISITQVFDSEILPACHFENAEPTEKRQTVFDEADISLTQVVDHNILPALNIANAEPTEKGQTVFDDANISITRAVDCDKLPALNIKRAKPVLKRQKRFDDADISITQVFDSEILPACHFENAEPTEKRQTVFDEADISITQAIDRDVLPAFKNETTRPMTEEKRLTVFESADISMTETEDFNKIKHGLIEETSKPIFDKHIKEVKLIVREDVDISMSEVSPQTINQKKSIAFEDKIVLIDGKSPNQFNEDNEVLDISMTDIQTHINTLNGVDASISKPIPSNLSNIQIDMLEKIIDKDNNEKADIQPNISQTFVYQLASSSGQIQKGTEKGDSKSQPCVNKSFMDIDDEKLATTAKISDDKNSDQSLTLNKYNGELENKNDVDENYSSTSRIDKESAIKSAVVSEVFDSKSISISSRFSADVGKGTVTLFTGKTDVQSPSVSQSSHGASEQNLKTESGPKLTSRPPSTYVINSESKNSDAKAKTKDSLLKDLLDMSKSSFDEGDEPKPNKELLKSPNEPTGSHDVDSSNGQATSDDRLFYITKDDEEMKDENRNISPPSLDNVLEESSTKNILLSLEDHDIKNKIQLKKKPHLSLEYKEENPMVDELQKKLELLQTVYLDKHLPEKAKESRTSHHSTDAEEDVILKDMNLSKCTNKFKLANDTKELLEMLSDLTDKGSPKKGTLDPSLKEVEENIEPSVVKGHLALENKTIPEEAESRRKPRSIVLNREDLLNDLSMASAALQNTRIDFDESIDDSKITESPESPEQSITAVRMNGETAKTLKFDEDSVDQDTNITPLRKTAFGETTYMTDPKSKVIPSYYKNVSDDLKELINYLVKPMADTLPYETSGADNRTKKIASTCSINIQANLITSSQIDVHTELYSNPGSSIDFHKDSSINIIEDAVKTSVTRYVKSPIKSATLTSQEVSKTNKVEHMPPIVPDLSEQKGVLIFDHNNPLNNVLLAPPAVGNVHKYNPGQSADTLSMSERSASVQISLPPIPSSEVTSTQMNVSNSDSNKYHSAIRKSLLKTESDISKPLSMDQCIDTVLTGVENRQVNTVIAMKGNKELLEASSSLTLVDGPLDRGPFWSNLKDNDKVERQNSHIQLLYKIESCEPGKLIDSDVTSNDSSGRRGSKKRAYSPEQRDKHKHCTLSSLDLTPQPLSKMQKIAQTPPPDLTQNPVKLPAEKDQADKSRQRSKSPEKPGTTVMVQQVFTEYDIKNQTPQIPIKEKSPKTDASSIDPRSNSLSHSGNHSLEIVSSFTSSKNLREDRSVETAAGWQDPEPDTPIYKSDPESDIVAKLNMLPFMGSRECEWETSTGERWSFRMLHSCFRLTVRLEHLYKRAMSTCIPADTPVVDVQLETLHKEEKNSIAVLCLRYAAEALRYELSSGCRTAGDVPSLLRRCARVARVAIHWERAMKDTRLRLAHTLTNDGLLSLMVANTPLRTVWEVRLKLELVVDRAGAAPWPRASALSVTRPIIDGPDHLEAGEVRRILERVPKDWGHVPRSIWRIFKYFKNKRVHGILGINH